MSDGRLCFSVSCVRLCLTFIILTLDQNPNRPALNLQPCGGEIWFIVWPLRRNRCGNPWFYLAEVHWVIVLWKHAQPGGSEYLATIKCRRNWPMQLVFIRISLFSLSRRSSVFPLLFFSFSPVRSPTLLGNTPSRLLPFTLSPVCCSVVPSRRDSPVCVWGPAWIHHARRQAERQHEGGGGGPAAVRHTAESAGGRLRIWSGGRTVTLLADDLLFWHEGNTSQTPLKKNSFKWLLVPVPEVIATSVRLSILTWHMRSSQW